MRRTRLALLFALSALTGAVALPAPAAAAGPKPASSHAKAKPGGRARPAPVDPMFALTLELTQKLASSDAATIRSALDDIRLAGKAAQAAVPAVSAVLERGVDAQTTEAALATLGDIESEKATPAILPYLVHRDAKVRRAAARALARTRGKDAVAAFVHALSDSDPAVRGTAATALGALGAKDTVRVLFVALDHRVVEAAASIGQLCAPTECERLLGTLGRLPFDVVTGGLDQILFRSPQEISDEEKLKVVGRVRELGTGEANKFLKDVQGRWPQGWSARVKQAIDQAVLATAGGSR